MDNIANQIVDNWKKEIESINVDGYTQKVESVNYFRMNKYYHGYPEIEYCYKVVFNFPFIYQLDHDDHTILEKNKIGRFNLSVDNRTDKWHKELELRFANIFYDNPDTNPNTGTEEWWKIQLYKPRPGSNSGQTIFKNDKVEYMTNQGYRFIVQFYPKSFIPILRDLKLKQIGI